MRAGVVLWLGLLSACGGSSSAPDANPGDGGIDPDASLCDDGTDGLCADPAVCASDPNCAPMDAPPGCVPEVLPPAPQDLFAGTTGLRIVRDVAASGSTVFAAVSPAGQSLTSSQVISCPSSGCAATPTVIGAVGADPLDGFLAAFADKVFWARRSSTNTSSPPNQVVRANLDGSGVTVLVTGDTVVHATRISRNATVYDDYAVVFDLSEAPLSGTVNGTNAGVRAATVDLVSPALANVRTPRYASSAVTGSDTYFVYWASPINTQPAPYDRKLHILDLDGNQLAVTSQAFQYVDRIQLDGNTLLFIADPTSSTIGMYACTLPACSDLHDVGTAVDRRGFDFQIRNGRVYFASVEDPGCAKGLQGVLASCDVASLVAGTCTRRFHSTSFHWVNLARLEIEDNAAFMWSKTSNTSLFKTAL